MRSGSICIAVLGASSGVPAQEAPVAMTVVPTPAPNSDSRKILWGSLRVGMTKAEVKLLHPKNLVPLGNGCHLVAYPRVDKKTGLNRIDMEWSVKDPSAMRCGELVRQTLISKYGEADATEREIKTNDCGNTYASGLAGALAGLCEGLGGDEPDFYSLARWNRDGIEISFKIDSKADDPKWWAVYRPMPVADASMQKAF